jgi:hypothetical protein
MCPLPGLQGALRAREVRFWQEARLSSTAGGGCGSDPVGREGRLRPKCWSLQHLLVSLPALFSSLRASSPPQETCVPGSLRTQYRCARAVGGTRTSGDLCQRGHSSPGSRHSGIGHPSPCQISGFRPPNPVGIQWDRSRPLGGRRPTSVC